MFDAIAPTYDLLNRLLSFGVDASWRRRLIRSLGGIGGRRVLDVACGTGDLLIGFAGSGPGLLVGVDLSFEMLRTAGRRMRQRGIDALLTTGAAEALPLASGMFDIVTVAFGIRNFEDVARALREMRRVLRPGGQMRILEFSRPPSGPWGALFRWYFFSILPKVGRWISGHPVAYSYLPASVASFHDADTLATLVQDAGMTVIEARRFTGGIATLWLAERPLSDVAET
jgi:demethylmenaquinone methyltransferase/2-methoxy-6-polyprenyl-1,4-benzoquinol methylase